MASESDSSSSSPSESPNSPPPPSSSPPPPTDKDSGSDSDNGQSPPPPPSDKGNDSDSPSSSPPPPPPPPSNGNSNSPTPPPPPRQSGQVFSPPPPPHKLSLPGHRSSSGSSDSSRGSSSSGSNSNSNKGTQLSVPVIIGIAGGAGLLLLVIILLFISCRRRRRRSESPIHYYEKPAKTDGDYFKHPNNEFNQGVYVVSIPPPPGGAPKVWAPSPPTGQFNSSESTSSNSGPYGPALPPPHPSVALGFNKSTFTYEELSIATGGFANENLLGQGGFGYVHKGVLPNGKSIAVKSLKSTGGQGDREFQAEVDIISRVHHRHLVSLVGYCISEGTKILIYEFVPNKTLEYHLHGKDRPVMPWNIRLKIAIGSAKGLAYLHEDCHPRIIHRDIKGANILIEDNFEAKVADFGLAKFTQDNNTHVSTRVMGTFGYLAPEYASSGKLTEKSDVFSYGVMLLELITGRRPIDTTGEYEDESLVDWARPLCTSAMENGKYEELVDSRLGNNYERNELACMVTCAAACVRHSARRRPKMSQIVRALEGDVSLDDLGEGVKAGGQNSVYSVEYNTRAYNADMEKFRKLALDSGSASSESRQTGEYGLNLSISK